MQPETARLILRRPRLTDAPALFEFLGDAEAMRYTHVDASLRACRRRIALHEWRRRRNGYAPWTVVAKASGQIIEDEDTGATVEKIVAWLDERKLLA